MSNLTKTFINAKIIGDRLRVPGMTPKPEGERSIGIVIPDDEFVSIQAEGWHVRFFSPRIGQIKAYLPVHIPSGLVIPNIDIDRLDTLKGRTCDVEVAGIFWSVPSVNREGHKAYLVSLKL